MAYAICVKDKQHFRILEANFVMSIIGSRLSFLMHL
jgi:hypothetical protein